MRIKLSDSKLFFDEILTKEKISLKQLAKDHGFNYSNLKQSRRGERTMSDLVFNKLIEISPNKNFWISDKEELKDNWGGIKGGSIAGRMLDSRKRAAYARSFRKIVKVNLKLDRFFCEFYGALLGDGCLSKFKDYQNKIRYVITLTGNLNLDKSYWVYLKKLLKERYDLNSYYSERLNSNTCVLSIKNKGFFFGLNRNYSVPIGLKYFKLKIDKKIVDLSWNVKKYVLRGLFDTDGCILANKREGYRYPWITISSKSEKFRNQIIAMLKQQGYPAYNTGSDVCVRGIKNVKRWFDDIGSSNNRNILKYEYFLKHGYLPARLLNGPIL